MVPQAIGSLAMIKLSLKLKLMISITKHHMCSFFVRKWFIFFLVVFMKVGLVNSDIAFGCDDPTHNPSSVQILSFLTQFSSLTTLQSLVSTEALQGGLTRHLVLSLMKSHVIPNFSNTNFARGFVNLDIVFRCDDPTYNPSPVQKLSLLTQFSGLVTLQSLITRKVLQWG